jgi:IS30 family transposase
VKLERATKKEVKKGIIKAISGYNVNSITSDNGSEFAGLAEIGEVI